MPASPSVREELAAHSQALRALARDLVGSAHADDLVQDTAVRALRSPPARGGGLFAWLATVMRNLAANHRRGERRRARREAIGAAAGAGDAASPPPGDDAEQRDTVRAVTDALWRLPDPYQVVLVARYFRGETPAAIAARTATPLATVKSRLQRGLELLRARLAQHDGQRWRLALLPAVGLPRAPLVPVPLVPVLAMTTLGKCAVASAAVAAVLLAWWMLDGVAVAPLAVAPADAAPASTGAAVGGGELPVDAPREAPGERPADAVAAGIEQPFVFEIRARVVDPNGAPVGDVALALAPPSCALAWTAERTDADGRVVVTWRARAASLVMAVGIGRHDTYTSLQQVRVETGVPAELRFVWGAQPMATPIPMAGAPSCGRETSDCRRCHAPSPIGKLFEVRGNRRAGLHPDVLFGDKLAIAPPEPGAWSFADGPGHLATAWGVTGERRRPPRALSGRVFTADGQPAGGVQVLGIRSGGTHFATQTRADGSWWFAAPLPGAGPVTLRAGGGGEGLATRELDVVDGTPSFVDLVLATGRTLRGRVIGSDGAPLADARVEYIAPAGEDHDLAITAPDGVFAFANLPPGPARLLLWGTHGQRFPLVEEPVVPDGPEAVLDLRARPGCFGSLRVAVRRADGAPEPDAEVRVWQQQTGRGASLGRLPDGAFHAIGLAAGFYRIEVGALASGWRDLGVHWVDGAGPTDLGTVQSPPSVRLRVDAPRVPQGPQHLERLLAAPGGAIEALELCALRDDVIVRADDVAPSTRELLLPPGRWLALWKTAAGVTARELTLVAGADAVLEVR